MSPPWMPLYVADYRADTAHLSAAEHGAYLLLIMHYWQTGSLPTDDRQIARIACMTPGEWKRAKPVVASFFTDDWRHKRIDEELAHAEEVISKRRAAAQSRYSKSGANGPAYAEHVQSKSEPDAPYVRVPPSPSPISDADASGAAAPPAYTDARHELWGEGKPILLELGVPERQCGQLIGRWLKTTGDDAAGVLDAIQRAREARPHEPIPWITRALPTKANHNERTDYHRPDRRPSGTDQAISALADAVARRSGGWVPPDDPRGGGIDAGAAPMGGTGGGPAGGAPRLSFGR